VTPRTGGVSVVPFAAVFTTNGREWRTEYTALRHRGLPLRYFVKDTAALASVVDLHVDKGVRVGYVMGIGDEVPAALEQLGARVTLLAEDDLASGDLARFDTIVTGTRAYAIRDDLRRHNPRLLDWVSAGGNLVVLYNTPEFDPRQLGPYPATLPQDAEEVSEEDAVVTVLRRSIRCCRHRTALPPPTSTGGSSSADPSSSPPGTIGTRRWPRATIAINCRRKVAGSRPPSAKDDGRTWPTRCIASCPTVFRARIDCWRI